MRPLCVLFFFLFVHGIPALMAVKISEKKAYERRRFFDGLQTSCESSNDALGCMKFKIIQSLESFINNEDNQHIEIRSISQNEEQQSTNGLAAFFKEYLRTHDITVKFPTFGTNVEVSPRNIDADEVNIKLKFATHAVENGDKVRSRKAKLKRLIIPIMIIILLKAMTFIPLAIGVLGLKAFNSLQLGFASFLLSAGLAIFQICKKLALDNHTQHLISHPHWEARADQSATESHQDIVYNAYA